MDRERELKLLCADPQTPEKVAKLLEEEFRSDADVNTLIRMMFDDGTTIKGALMVAVVALVEWKKHLEEWQYKALSGGMTKPRNISD